MSPAIPRQVWAAAAVIFLLATLTAPLAPLFDPDEGYYPATAAESIDAGSPWDPRFNGEPRWDKPILTYALIGASFAAWGRTVAAARLPNAVEGALLILIVGAVVSRLAGSRAAAWSAAVAASTLGVQLFTRVAHPEMAVVLSTTATTLVTVLWFNSTEPSRRPALAAAAGAAVGFGLLAKGPVAIVLPALATVVVLPFAWPRDRGIGAVCRDIAIAAGVASAIASPWYLAMWHRHGSAFVHEALWRQNIARYTEDVFGHPASPWFFLVPTVVGAMPWTALIVPALRGVSRSDVTPRGVLRLFMAGAALVAFVFYSMSDSKLANYALALIPPLAILTGLHVADVTQAPDGRQAFRPTAVLLAISAVVVALAPFAANDLFTAREIVGGAPIEAAPFERLLRNALNPVACVFGFGALAVASVRPRAAALTLVAIGAIVPTLLLFAAQPLLREAYPWEDFGRLIRPNAGPVFLVGPRAPSLTFHAGRPVLRVPGADDVAERIPPGTGGWLVAGKAHLAEGRLDGLSVRVVAERGTMALARVWPDQEVVGSR